MSKQAPSTSEYDLVSFEHPPVAEVALSVQFAEETIDLEAAGAFANMVRADLPVRERHPVVPPLVEAFDPAALPPAVEIRFDVPLSLPRMWFLSTDRIQLVQLQHDRLVLNWREADGEAPYPRYDQLRKRFAELLGSLIEAIRATGQSEEINLCEVTYVNPVDADLANETAGHPDLASIINRVKRRPDDAFLPEAEDAQLQARWRIPGRELGEDAEAVGRLYLTASPGLKPPKGDPVYLLNLSARLHPAGTDFESALRALDVAHKWVVLGFKDLTTPEMHRVWGLKEVAP